MDTMEQIRQTFFQEAEELLAELESGLLAFQDGDTDTETVNAIFRAVHSIKGGAGMFDLAKLVDFAHVFETVLDNLRSKKIGMTPSGMKTMLKSADMLADLVKAARAGTDADDARASALMAELSVLAGGDHAPAAGRAPEPVEAEPEAAPSNVFAVRFRAKPELYAKANDPALLLRELARLGKTTVTCDASDLPLLPELDAEGAYLTWNVRLETAETLKTVRDVFEFVEGDCDLDVTDGTETAQDGADDGFDVAALLARMQTELGPDATAEAQAGPIVDLESVLKSAPRAEPSNVVDLAETRAQRQPEPEVPAAAARNEEAKSQNAGLAASQTIRVDLDRLDRLVNLVGELVINRAMVAQRVMEAGLANSTAISVGLEELEQLTREIQDNVMGLRAQPVKSVFQRMLRLAREVGDMTGKQVQLIIEGESTEVDKTVVERLTDPLTHMIRNAIDHGLETPEKRLAAGKPETGIVNLTARHASGHIVIEVSDDGAGLNRPRVKEIAINKGLIPADAQLTDEETDNLIFLPGFSTASSISNISGRGVGLDVVKRSVQALGGRISIASRPGRGSTFTLSLPLTLAVLDGMVVSVADQTLVIPLTATVETLQPKPEDVHSFGGNCHVIAVRNMFTPLIDIGKHFGYRTTPPDLANSVGLLVEAQGNTRTVLLVDAIQGQRQVVIKSLEPNYGSVPGIAAATILGDGRVALILDVDAIVSEAATVPGTHESVLAATG
jgi:two-component system chemotaxis sensor kinase CheA